MVVGALGKHVNKYSVVSFTQKEIFGDFWTYLNEFSKMYFTSGIVLNGNIFQTSTVTSELGINDIVNIKGLDVDDIKQLDYPCPPVAIIGCVTVSIQRLRGVTIVIGP